MRSAARSSSSTARMRAACAPTSGSSSSRMVTWVNPMPGMPGSGRAVSSKRVAAHAARRTRTARAGARRPPTRPTRLRRSRARTWRARRGVRSARRRSSVEQGIDDGTVDRAAVGDHRRGARCTAWRARGTRAGGSRRSPRTRRRPRRRAGRRAHPAGGVEPDERLVDEEHGERPHEREHDRGLLAQAAAEAGGQVVGAGGEVEDVEQLVADFGRAGPPCRRDTYSMCSFTVRSS